MGGRPRPRHDSRSRPPSMDSAYLSSPLLPIDALPGGSYFNQRTNAVPRLAASPYPLPTDDVSESSGSDSVPGFLPRRHTKANDSPLQSFATELTNDLRSHSGLGTPPGEQKFVGTPDYLAPETILGLRGDDAAVDWVCFFTIFCFFIQYTNLFFFQISGLWGLSHMSSFMAFLLSTLKRQKRCSKIFFLGTSNGTKTGSNFQAKPVISCNV